MARLDAHRDRLLRFGIAAGLGLAWIAGALWLLGPGAPPGAALPLARRLGCAGLGLPLVFVLGGVVGGPGWRASLFALATPLGLLWTVYGSGLAGWWTRDDPCLLRSAAAHGIGAHFIDPSVWRALSGNVLMPWSVFSLGLDLRLFGLRPGAFYFHQLLAFSLFLLLAFGLLRTVVRPGLAGLALALFVLSAPACAVVLQLMNRHYLEGFLLALLSLTLFRHSLPRERPALSYLGAVVYLLAATAKEVFVPLVVVLPFLPLGTLRQRLGRALPYAVAAGLYGVWRVYLLGRANVLASYGTRTSHFEAGDLLTLPTMLGLGAGWQVAAGAVVLGGAGLVALRSRQRLALAAAVALATAVPLLPVLADLEPRHLFLPLFAAAVLVAYALERSRPRHGALLGVALLLLACGTLVRAPFWRFHPASAQHYEAEGRFVLEATTPGVLLTTLPDVAFLICVDDLRRQVVARDGGPGFCGAPCACQQTLDGQTWRYEAGRIIAGEEVAPACDQAPLAVTLSHDAQAGRLHWQLGPSSGSGDETAGTNRAATYRFVLVTGEERPGVSIPLPVPPSGNTPLYLRQPLRLIVQQRSTDGSVSSSPVLTLAPGQTVRSAGAQR